MKVEHSIENYRFSCRNCARTWFTEYEVRTGASYGGDVWSTYLDNLRPAVNPSANTMLCPGCHRSTVTARIAARRDHPGV